MSEFSDDDAESRREARGRQPVGPPNFPRRRPRPVVPAQPAPARPEAATPQPPAPKPPSLAQYPGFKAPQPRTEPRLLVRRVEDEEAENAPPFNRRQKGFETPDEARGFTRRMSSQDEEAENGRRLPSLLAGFSRRHPNDDEEPARAPRRTSPTLDSLRDPLRAPIRDPIHDPADEPLPPPVKTDSRPPMRRVSPLPYPSESGSGTGSGRGYAPPRPEQGWYGRSQGAAGAVRQAGADTPSGIRRISFLEAYRAAEARLAEEQEHEQERTQAEARVAGLREPAPANEVVAAHAAQEIGPAADEPHVAKGSAAHDAAAWAEAVHSTEEDKAVSAEEVHALPAEEQPQSEPFVVESVEDTSIAVEPIESESIAAEPVEPESIVAEPIEVESFAVEANEAGPEPVSVREESPTVEAETHQHSRLSEIDETDKEAGAKRHRLFEDDDLAELPVHNCPSEESFEMVTAAPEPIFEHGEAPTVVAPEVMEAAPQTAAEGDMTPGLHIEEPPPAEPGEAHAVEHETETASGELGAGEPLRFHAWTSREEAEQELRTSSEAPPDDAPVAVRETGRQAEHEIEAAAKAHGEEAPVESPGPIFAAEPFAAEREIETPRLTAAQQSYAEAAAEALRNAQPAEPAPLAEEPAEAEPQPEPDENQPLFATTRRMEWEPRRMVHWLASEPAPEPVGATENEPALAEPEPPMLTRDEEGEPIEAFQVVTRRMEWEPRRTWSWRPEPQPEPEPQIAETGPSPQPVLYESEAFVAPTRRLGSEPRPDVAAPDSETDETMRNRDQDDLNEPRRLVLNPDPAPYTQAPMKSANHDAEPFPAPAFEPPAPSADDELFRAAERTHFDELRVDDPASEAAEPEELHHHSAESAQSAGSPLPAKPEVETVVAQTPEPPPAEPRAERASPSFLSSYGAGSSDYTADADEKKRFDWSSPLFIGLLVPIVLAIIGLLVWLFLMRHSMNKNLPALDGTQQIRGLKAQVTVARNAQGVPTLTAQSLDDLIFAQGYVTASDRLWQMDGLRRHAAGELAEILGSSQLEHDRLQRTLGLRYTADRAVAMLPSDERHQLERYADGVNAYIRTHSDSLPLEFHLLHYKPAPWQPRDSVLVGMALFQDLSSEFPLKLAREQVSAHLPPELAADLYPFGSWRDHPPGEAIPDITSPKQVEEIPLDPTQSQLSLPPSSSTVGLEGLFRFLEPCNGCKAGSNGWVVAGSRTASGKPMLSNDMHLSLNVPDIWYEASLHAPLDSVQDTAAPAARLDVEGFSLPGLPFVLVGRNEHVAWGITNLTGDVQDVRIEHLRGTGSSEEFERADGSWQPVKTRTEIIHVRGGFDQKLEVTSVTHTIGNGNAGETAVGTTELETPILTPVLKGETRPLSLSWTALDPANVRVSFLGANAAKTGGDLVAAMSSLGGPPLNLMYADDTGLIGYHALGRIPVRGPAVHHPRQVEPLILPPPEPGTTPSDEPSSEPGEEPGDITGREPKPAPKGSPKILKQGWQPGGMSQPELLLTSFSEPAQKRTKKKPAAKAPVKKAQPKKAAAKPEPRKRATVPAVAKAKPQAPTRREQPIDDDVPPPKPQLDYTIGSPIPIVPVDALDTAADWSGYIPYSSMPAVQNPATGFLVTANSRVSASDYPYQLATDWVSPFRTERLIHLLEHRRGLVPHDMLQIELDVQSDMDQALAERLAYALDHASPKVLEKDRNRLHEAADLLRSFKGGLDPGSASAAVEWTARKHLLPMLLTAKIMEHDGGATTKGKAADIAALYHWNENGTALERIITDQPARWLPAGYANWNDFLATAIEEALTEEHAPSKLSSWRYGELHQVSIDHPVLAMIPGLSSVLGVKAGSGPRQLGGYRETIRASELHFGSSERFTADLGAPMNSAGGALANITSGESGNPKSAYFLDQMDAWFEGTTFPLHYTTLHMLTLTP